MTYRPAQPDDKWARLKDFKDPITGKVVPQNPQGEPVSLAEQLGTAVPNPGKGGLR